ncbi:hypothetical protein K435DRAFT_138881 [Dendrothele bispora CBS 962.96]|uniref:F-box domain-containing protein n=1 Tax=Dendrothele bispora (strain CBS 962.96) TaxID=1314807 RepID=A0A4S8MQS8_DENBC|nr:hypothetical protein K435DRAFT_138881 [Dendrothele bispora CBS 962.96]
MAQRSGPQISPKISLCNELEKPSVKTLARLFFTNNGIDHHDTKNDGKSLTTRSKRRRIHQAASQSFLARNLPVEILMFIFTYCCCDPESNDTFGLEIFHDRYDATTLALSHTCALWRNIVKSMGSKLWSRLSLNLACVRNGWVELAMYYLRRADDHPLTLRVVAYNCDAPDVEHRYLSSEHDDQDNDPAESNPDAHYATRLSPDGWTMLGLLMTELNNWFEVHFDMEWDIFNDERFGDRDQVLSPWRLHFGNLRSLSLSWPDTSPFVPTHFFQLFEEIRTPKLQSLILKDTSIVEDLPLCKATEVIVPRFFSDDDALIVFNECLLAKQVSFIVAEDYSHSPWDEFKKIVTHERIEELTIEAPFGADAIGYIVSLVTLPALASLRLSATGIGQAQPRTWWQSLPEMLMRSRCTALRELDLSGDLFTSDGGLLEVLASTPCVTHFSLDARLRYYTYFTRRFLQALVLDDDNGKDETFKTLPSETKTRNLLPRLQVCRFVFKQGAMSRFVRLSLPDPELILRMLKSRRSISSPSPFSFPFSSSSDQDGRGNELEKFEMSARLCPGPDARRWAETFSVSSPSMNGSFLRALESDGLGLRMDIRFWDEIA